MSIVTPEQFSKTVKEALEAINAIRAALGRVADPAADPFLSLAANYIPIEAKEPVVGANKRSDKAPPLSELAHFLFTPKKHTDAPADALASQNIAAAAAAYSIGRNYEETAHGCEEQLKMLEECRRKIWQTGQIWRESISTGNERIRKLPQEGSNETLPCFSGFKAYTLYYPNGKEVACCNDYDMYDLVGMLRCEGGQKFLAEWEAWFADMLPKPSAAEPVSTAASPASQPPNPQAIDPEKLIIKVRDALPKSKQESMKRRRLAVAMENARLQKEGKSYKERIAALTVFCKEAGHGKRCARTIQDDLRWVNIHPEALAQ